MKTKNRSEFLEFVKDLAEEDIVEMRSSLRHRLMVLTLVETANANGHEPHSYIQC